MTTYNDELSRYYKILGIEPGASQEEVKQAYRDLVKVWHPDNFSDNPRLQQKAQEKLKEINIAYEKLEKLSNQSAQTGTYTQKQRSSQEEGSRQQYRASETKKPKKEQETGSRQEYRSSGAKQPQGSPQTDKDISYKPLARIFGGIAASAATTIGRRITFNSFNSPLMAGFTIAALILIFYYLFYHIGVQIVKQINSLDTPRNKKITYAWIIGIVGFFVVAFTGVVIQNSMSESSGQKIIRSLRKITCTSYLFNL